jgi:hypothetical protein
MVAQMHAAGTRHRPEQRIVQPEIARIAPVARMASPGSPVNIPAAPRQVESCLG